VNRRGVALLAVLWLVTALGVTVASASRWLRTEQRATANRLALGRGRWAAEACAAIAQARWRDRRETRLPVDLGREVRCAWSLDDPALRLDVNRAEPAMLARLLTRCGANGDSAAGWAQRLARRRAVRPFADLDEVEAVAPLTPRARALLAVEAGPRVSANAAHEVITALPGLTAEAADVLRRRAMSGRPVGSLDELAGLVSPAARAPLHEHYAALSGLLEFAPSRLVLTAQGWVGSDSARPRASLELLVVPLPGRLAVVRRRWS
jgi:type II secretory pathway component PulK